MSRCQYIFVLQRKAFADIYLLLEEVNQYLLVLLLNEAGDVAEKVVEKCVLHESDRCLHDAVAHLNLNIFTAQAEVKLAYGQRVFLEDNFGIMVGINLTDRKLLHQHLLFC